LKNVLLQYKSLYVKFECNIILIDIDSGELLQKRFLFPENRTFELKSNSLDSVLSSLHSLVEKLHSDPLSDTKKKLHEFQSLTIKIAKNHFGGCSNYVKPAELQGKKCLVQPLTTDNLCFWRCIAIALDRQLKVKSDMQKNRKRQKDAALQLQSKYYENQDMQDIVHLSQIKDISDKLNLNLIIYTLVKQDN